MNRPDPSTLAVMARQCSVTSPRGAVAAAAPAAARAGIGALDDGGNAYDAVVAAALAETVLLPPKCGLAGDLVALVWSAQGPGPEALVAVGRATDGLADAARAGRLAETGPLSVGVPGAPAGYLALADRARLDLTRLAAPAIEAATEGFCWSDICATLGQESAALVAATTPGPNRYFPDGEPLPAGAVVTLPGLGRALQSLVAEREGFLLGPVGRAIVEVVTAAGGVLTVDDLDQPRPRWVATDSISVDGPGRTADRLHATPAPTHGPSLLEAVAAVASGGAGLGRVHRSVMAAIARRRHELCDPGGTSMVSAVDADGTLAVVVHSNSYPRFGSGLIVDRYDLVLSNRAGRGFSADPGHPNFPAPGRRPATTLHAWGLERNGTRFLGATPGGANQMPWNAQSLTRLLAGASPAQAIVSPRWEWRATDDGVRFERGLEPAAVEELAGAPSVEEVGLWELRSAMQIAWWADGVGGTAVDPRTQGSVIPR